MFYLQKKYVDQMVCHALQEAPNECCGILAGEKGQIVKMYQTTNAEKSPVRYLIKPIELINAYQEIDANKWELLAIYHSHPEKEAYPSEIDVKFAYLPQAIYIIISLKDPHHPVVRAFNIDKNGITERELIIQE
jgi:[CysO sulfur-carrier protein]-S-L-cysteine hydrolase